MFFRLVQRGARATLKFIQIPRLPGIDIILFAESQRAKKLAIEHECHQDEFRKGGLWIDASEA